jgi:hypothetical protein
MAALYYNPDRLVGPATVRLTRREDRSAQLGRGPENLGNRAPANYRCGAGALDADRVGWRRDHTERLIGWVAGHGVDDLQIVHGRGDSTGG